MTSGCASASAAALVVSVVALSGMQGSSAFVATQQSLPQQAKVSLATRETTRRRASGLVMMGEGGRKGVLFVCLGNICRSPTAEAVFASVVGKAGRQSDFDIDSCGTGGGSGNWYKEGGFSYHEGEAADPRMKSTAAKRGVDLKSRSRPLRCEDFERFERIVYMDDSNRMAITEAANHWGISPEVVKERVRSMMSYSKVPGNVVPDPYYGGPDGFEKVLDLLDEACTGLLEDMS